MIRLDHEDWYASIHPVSISATRLEADLPSDTPIGELAISVANDQGSSRPEKVIVSSSSPGIFTLNGEGWGPVAHNLFRFGKKVTLHVNGMNKGRPKIFVAGLEARVTSVRGQNLTFAIPRGAAAGCWTPVWIQSESGNLSNFATIPIHDRSGHCEQPEGWPVRPVPPQTRNGFVILFRVSGSIAFQPGKSTNVSFDAGTAIFFQPASGGLTPFQILPPSGTCIAYAGTFSLNVMQQLFSIRRYIGEYRVPLNAGLSVTVDGGGTKKAVLRGTPSQGQYAALLGGTLPLSHGERRPLFFAPGSYRVASEGSENITKLEMAVEVPPPFDWVNQASVSEIDRSKGVELKWRNLGQDRQTILTAFSADSDTGAMGSCVCTAPSNATEMQIPPYAFANFPKTSATSILPLQFLILVSIPRAERDRVPLPGLSEVRTVSLMFGVRMSASVDLDRRSREVISEIERRIIGVSFRRARYSAH
jgi:hypothetical protein